MPDINTKTRTQNTPSKATHIKKTEKMRTMNITLLCLSTGKYSMKEHWDNAAVTE